jgi:hypothetical protein
VDDGQKKVKEEVQFYTVKGKVEGKANKWYEKAKEAEECLP